MVTIRAITADEMPMPEPYKAIEAYMNRGEDGLLYAWVPSLHAWLCCEDIVELSL